MKSVSRILLAAALAVGFAVSVLANDREQFSVTELTVEGGIKAPLGNTLWISNAVIVSPTISGATQTGGSVATPALTAGTSTIQTNETIASRTVTTGPAGTNASPYTWAVGLCTNGNTVVFATPFAGVPTIVLEPTSAYAGTNTAMSVTSRSISNFVVGGSGTAEAMWFAVGIK